MLHPVLRTAQNALSLMYVGKHAFHLDLSEGSIQMYVQIYFLLCVHLNVTLPVCVCMDFHTIARIMLA